MAVSSVRRPHAACLSIALLIALGCQPRARVDPAPTDSESAEESPSGRGERARASRRAASGATCQGREDCTGDQVCVDHRCRYRETSVEGEVLAAAAEAQVAVGDWAGAIATYEQAIRAFAEHDVPVPPDIACGRAEVSLTTATDEPGRERGALAADLCFRSTVPGDPLRASVRRALARLRFEGLDLARFDNAEPGDDFFDDERATRPTIDAIVVELSMPDIEERGTSHEAVRNILTSEPAKRAIADCYLQDWGVRHSRSATAEVRLTFSTALRDLGDYDVYEPRLAAAPTTGAQDGFEPCLVEGLPDLIEDGNDSRLRGEWAQTVRITARVQ